MICIQKSIVACLTAAVLGVGLPGTGVTVPAVALGPAPITLNSTTSPIPDVVGVSGSWTRTAQGGYTAVAPPGQNAAATSEQVVAGTARYTADVKVDAGSPYGVGRSSSERLPTPLRDTRCNACHHGHGFQPHVRPCGPLHGALSWRGRLPDPGEVSMNAHRRRAAVVAIISFLVGAASYAATTWPGQAEQQGVDDAAIRISATSAGHHGRSTHRVRERAQRVNDLPEGRRSVEAGLDAAADEGVRPSLSPWRAATSTWS